MKLKGQIFKKLSRKQSGQNSLISYLWKFRVKGSKEGMTPRFLVWWMVVPSAATINAAGAHVY